LTPEPTECDRVRVLALVAGIVLVLDNARGNIDNELCELVGVARALA
jgi:hypothetical protein